MSAVAKTRHDDASPDVAGPAETPDQTKMQAAISAAEHARAADGGRPSAGVNELPYQVHAGDTMEMVLTGRQFTAQEMAGYGLVNRVVPKGEHLTEALKLAKEIAAKAPIAARLAKESVLAAFETPLEEGLERERKSFFLLFATEDMREGMRAFIENRQANFQGK